MQTWIPEFNANKLQGLRVPTWVTLRGILGEFMKVATQIASRLGVLMRSDNWNAVSLEQRFSVAMEAGVDGAPCCR